MDASVTRGIEADGRDDSPSSSGVPGGPYALEYASPEGFGRLVEMYADRIYNTIYRMCGHHEDSRDLMQETFCRAFQAIDRFRGSASVYTWLARIAMNLTISHLRKRRNVRIVPLDADSGVGSDLSASERDPRHAASDLEQSRRIEDAIGELDDQHRAVIVLRDVEDLDYSQIGEILDLPVGTVKSRIHRARMILRDVLKDLASP